MRARTAGLTMIEVIVTLTVLSIAILGVLTALISSSSLTRTSRESEIALEKIRNESERLRALPVDQLVAALAAMGATTPTHKAQVGIAELQSAALTVALLSETDTRTQLGTGALDLDNDGQPDEDDANSDRTKYGYYPVRFQVRWVDGLDRGNRKTQRTETMTTVFYPRVVTR